jgi:hypothetical protein
MVVGADVAGGAVVGGTVVGGAVVGATVVGADVAGAAVVVVSTVVSSDDSLPQAPASASTTTRASAGRIRDTMDSFLAARR